MEAAYDTWYDLSVEIKFAHSTVFTRKMVHRRRTFVRSYDSEIDSSTGADWQQ